jgi:transposase
MMAMGRRKKTQEQMFLPTARGGGHRFYEALNKLLDEAAFDKQVEDLCAPHYADDDKPGRPSIAPGLYFRMLLIGYFEGIGSERGIAWRCADSISLRDFLNLPSHVAVPDSSTVSRTRRRLPPEVFEAVFQLVLNIVDDKGLLRGKVRGVDSTYLKGDASMRSIVRKDTGEGYRDYIKRVTAEDEASANKSNDNDGDPPASGPSSGGDLDVDAAPKATSVDEAPRKVTAEEAVRHDRKRKKTTSNDDWASSTDEDARITRMKNGTTRLAYKAEHVVDMETGAILAAEVFKGNEHDASTLETSLTAAEKNMVAARAAPATVEDEGEPWHKEPIAEVVADKGYHKASVLLALQQRGYRTFIPEKKQRGRRKFTDKGGQDAARAFHANRARTRRRKGKEHQRRRGELLERPNQHLYDRGDLRELTVTGQTNVKKRVVIQAAGFNLGLVMRKLMGAGTPKRLAAALVAFLAAILAFVRHDTTTNAANRRHHHNRSWWAPPPVTQRYFARIRVSASAC